MLVIIYLLSKFDDKVEIKAYPSIICEVEVYWMTKGETAWILESLLERLNI